jgi:hypothetical protein
MVTGKKIVILMCLGLIMPGTGIFAFKDGEPGETSTGGVTTSIDVKQSYIIRGLSDYSLGTIPPGRISEEIVGSAEGICIGTNGISLKAGVTVSGESDDDGFFMSNTQKKKNQRLSFRVTINDGTTDYEMLPGQQTTMNASLIQECIDGEENHSLQIIVKANQKYVPAGEYKTSLTFLADAPNGE